MLVTCNTCWRLASGRKLHQELAKTSTKSDHTVFNPEQVSSPHKILSLCLYIISLLLPCLVIEWGNNWARAINHRKSHDGPFAGFFSQIGRLYNVHHIWCYPSLQARKETREAAWKLPGWDECVAYTVPLINDMHTRICVPTEFSPTQ